MMPELRGSSHTRSTPTAATPLMSAMELWGLAGSVLALETVKRAIRLDNVSRDLLIGALLARKLLEKLLRKLDWQQQDQDEEVCRCCFKDT